MVKLIGCDGCFFSCDSSIWYSYWFEVVKTVCLSVIIMDSTGECCLIKVSCTDNL